MTQVQTGALGQPKSGLLSPEGATGADYASEAPSVPRILKDVFNWCTVYLHNGHQMTSSLLEDSVSLK